jgi:predicted Zn-dependent protease
VVNVPVAVYDKKTGVVYQNLKKENFQNLALLGVSREYEEEAELIGVQYAWKSGHDPKGFITFFNKMVSEKGYVRSASFFRTHPPFFERIVGAFSEIEYLPDK